MPIAVSDKPKLREYIPQPEATEDLDYAALHTLDLSLMDTPEGLEELVKVAKISMVKDGFLYLKNHGLSIEEIHRQFQIAQYCLIDGAITSEERKTLAWDQTGGTFAGYKPRGEWGIGGGAVDMIEHFNWYQPQFKSPEGNIPQALLPFYAEVRAFVDKTHNVVQRRLLRILSLVLELPDDYLWEHVHSNYDAVGDGYLRQMLYHPLSDEQRELSGGRMMTGHIDHGTTTLLFSQPVSALQVMMPDEVWRYVRYEPGTIVVNLGETFEMLTGYTFKATRHRVFSPPQSQQHMQRLGIIVFCHAKPEVRLEPILESPFVRERPYKNRFQGLIDEGKPVPSAGVYKRMRVASYSFDTNELVYDEEGRPMRETMTGGVLLREYI